MSDELNFTEAEEKRLPPFDQVPLAEKSETPPKKKTAFKILETSEDVRPWLDIKEGGDVEVWAMDVGEVCSDLDLCNRACAEYNRQSDLLHSRLKDIQEALVRVDGLSNLLGRHQQRLQSQRPQNPNDSVKQFQQRSIERRLDQHQAIQKVLTSGASVKDLQKALTTGSPLDNAHKRQTGFGTKRPSVPFTRKVEA